MEQIAKFNVYLFDYDYFNCTEEELDKRIAKAREIIKNNNWLDVFNSWDSYLINNCKTEKEIINFYELLYSYIVFEMYVPYPNDPYDFIGFMLAKVDLDKNWDLCGDLLDTLANQVLENSNNLDLQKDPYYQFWKDPKVIDASKKYIKQ